MSAPTSATEVTDNPVPEEDGVMKQIVERDNMITDYRRVVGNTKDHQALMG